MFIGFILFILAGLVPTVGLDLGVSAVLGSTGLLRTRLVIGCSNDTGLSDVEVIKIGSLWVSCSDVGDCNGCCILTGLSLTLLEGGEWQNLMVV